MRWVIVFVAVLVLFVPGLCLGDGLSLPTHGAVNEGDTLHESLTGTIWLSDESALLFHKLDDINATLRNIGAILNGDTTSAVAMSTEISADDVATLAMSAGTIDFVEDDWYNMEFRWSPDEVFTIAEIVKMFELAVELIGPVNEIPGFEVGSTYLIYTSPPKPAEKLREESEILKLKAERLEKKEADLKKINEFIRMLRRIEK